MTEKEEIGTVISNVTGPSPGDVSFVVNSGKVHRGQFVEIECEQGKMVCLVTDVFKTNRYFERAESVKEFELQGKKLFEQFPTGEWEYLAAQTRPLGIYSDDGTIKRPTYPPSPGAKVKIAGAKLLEKFLGFEKGGLNIGDVEYHSLPVELNMSRLLKKHLAVLAMSGAGKCLEPSSKVLLSDGKEVSIGALVDKQLDKGFVIEEGVQIRRNSNELSVMSFSKDNKFVKSPITAFMRRKSPEQLIKLKTRTGRVLELTKEHLIPVLRENIEWVPAELLSENDFLLLPRLNFDGSHSKIDFFEILIDSRKVFVSDKNALNFLRQRKKTKKLTYYQIASKLELSRQLVVNWLNRSVSIKNLVKLCKILEVSLSEIKSRIKWLENKQKKIPLFVECNSEFARLLGYWLAEGHNCETYISFVNQNKKIRQDYAFLLEKIFGEKISYRQKEGSELRFCNALLSRVLVKIGFTSSSHTKYLHDSILNGEKETFCNFLSSFIDCDGFVARDKAELEVCLASKKLIESLDFLLWRLGCISVLKTKSVKGKNYFRLFVRGAESFIKLFKSLNFLIDYKYFRLKSNSLKLANPNMDVVPNTGLHLQRIMVLLQMSQPQNESSGIINYLHRKDNPSRNSLQKLLNLFNKRLIELKSVCDSDDFALKQILSLTHKLNFSSQMLVKDLGMHKQALYEYAVIGKNASLEREEKIKLSFKDKLEALQKNFAEAEERIKFLQSLINSNLFFDKIKKIEPISSKYEFVYDLSVEKHNFIANRTVVHNSVAVKKIIEEILERKKEQGRLAIIVMDVHGEYTSFGEPVVGGAAKDYSSKTKIVKAQNIRIGVSKLSVGLIAGIVPGISRPQRRDFEKILLNLRNQMKSGEGPFDLAKVKSAIQESKDADKTKTGLLSWISTLESLNLFSKTDAPSINDVVKPGQLTVIDFSDLIDLKKKQVIVSYVARRLFNDRRGNRVCPFLIVVEEAHQMAPEKVKSEAAISRGIIETIAREGRKFGASLCLVSQRPVNLSTTALSQCGTHFILRITNPYDLKHIGESSESLDSKSTDMITSLRVGEALLVGEAVNHPVFFKVKKNRSPGSKHEISLEKAAKEFEKNSDEQESEASEFLR